MGNFTQGQKWGVFRRGVEPGEFLAVLPVQRAREFRRELPTSWKSPWLVRDSVPYWE